MKHKKIRKLFAVIFDEGFSGEFEKPKLKIRKGASPYCGLYYGTFHEVTLWVDMHDDDSDIADTLTHELVHARQWAQGRRLNHGKWFKRQNKKMFKKVKAFFNA